MKTKNKIITSSQAISDERIDCLLGALSEIIACAKDGYKIGTADSHSLNLGKCWAIAESSIKMDNLIFLTNTKIDEEK